MNIQINSAPGITGSSSAQLLAGSNQALSDAFRQELASVLESTLEKYGINPGGITISVNPASSPGQARQNIVVGSIAATPNSIANAAAPPASSNLSRALSTPPSFDEGYWANQPAAVQSLRDISDPTQRMGQAMTLMEKGYKIDVPIMVWGWDPQKVTDLRQSFGYSWVPSAGQANLPEAPGVTVPGLQAYDPKNPPANSIQVA